MGRGRQGRRRRRAGAAVDTDELIAFVKERKGSVLAPKSVELVDAIPLTSVGKHDKKASASSTGPHASAP
jgi:acyl-CoA synthetase (AMP-forming)/AMP-acid ligase II